MGRTYTGPTAAGGTATVQCQDWCTEDHEYWGDTVDDMFHRSESAVLSAPRDRAGRLGHVVGGVQVPLLEATLSVYSGDPRPSGASVWLARDEQSDHGVELDVAGVDALLGQLDDFRGRLAGLRDTLARIDKDRRQNAA